MLIAEYIFKQKFVLILRAGNFPNLDIRSGQKQRAWSDCTGALYG